MNTAQKERCKVERISAPMADDAIISRLEEVFEMTGVIDEVKEKLNRSYQDVVKDHLLSKKMLKNNLSRLENEIKEMTHTMTKVEHETSLRALEKELKILIKDRDEVEKRLQEVREKIAKYNKTTPSFSTKEEIISFFWKGWKKTSLHNKRTLLRGLFEKITVSENGLKGFVRIMKEEEKLP